MQFNAWRFAFVQIGFKATGKLFVVAALLLHVHVVPLGQIAHAKPVQQDLHVLGNLCLPCCIGVCAKQTGLLLHAAGKINLHLQKEMPGLVQIGG